MIGKEGSTMKWLVALAFWFLYWGICYLATGSDKKNLAGLRSYPDAVQDLVRERIGEVAPKAQPVRRSSSAIWRSLP